MTTPPLTPARERTIVFDFDGTVSLGHGPVRAYARAASAVLGSEEAATFLAAVDLALDHAPSGQLAGTEAIDGYDLVRLLSAEHGIDPATLSDAYLASRTRLATADSPITAPRGLPEFLRFARDYASIVLATNAPDIRVPEAIGELGLTGLFDAVYTSVGKPGGLDQVLDDWLPRGELLSVGDVWVNDLAPASARGALTALVGSPDTAATPTYRADHLHELYPVIAAWLESNPSDTDRTTTATTTTMKGPTSVL
ncbi:HAD family hydrolase [Conyzicola sp.]|uniref:HAD family hydrolase n=1 Tax=Conyzicola sp. TaxID=1969404 RepID=UPI00398A372B